MKTVDMPLHELATIAATRAMAGAGLALVVTEQVPKEQRKAVGWTLLAIGGLSTIPLAVSIFKRLRQ